MYETNTNNALSRQSVIVDKQLLSLLKTHYFFPRLIQQDTNLLNSYKKIIQAKQGERLSSPEI